jgi:hypothetical protein
MRGEKFKHLKFTYLSNYLTKMKQKIVFFKDAIIQKNKIDQIMVKDVHL